jgi:hypothetical protein
MRPFDLQIQTRKSRSATDTAKLGALVADDSILLLSRGEKPPQEKATNRS